VVVGWLETKKKKKTSFSHDKEHTIFRDWFGGDFCLEKSKS
jgi:hypothetical protein